MAEKTEPKKKSSTKGKSDKNVPKEAEESVLSAHSLIEIKKKFVRVEYPGVVKNVNKAIETLGGIKSLELAVADTRHKLNLHFHPQNKFNKGVLADRDTNPYLLLKVTQTNGGGEKKYDYEIVGITVLNFVFNRIIDYQYLPLIGPPNESKESKVDYFYDIIFPKEIPTREWYLQKENKEQRGFFLPSVFSRFECSNQTKLYLKTEEKYEHHLRPEVAETVLNMTKKQKRPHQSLKQISIFINFQKLNVEIPFKPLDYTMQLVNDKQLTGVYENVKALFEKRPIWSKVAVLHKTGLSQEHAKIVLPAVAYFCNTGPWRMAWIKFGYNPQKDSNSRIYQTLDYRIRTAEGTKLKVNAKRNYASKTLYYYYTQGNVQKITLDDKIALKKSSIQESSYILTPTTIPPARQLFYQYCDIYIPEIKEMLSRLPKPHSEADYDPKNGWFPQNFTEQCREIVNSYVLNQVQEQLLEDSKKQREQSARKEESTRKPSTPTYCSEMLSNIKKGLYKSVQIGDITQPGGSQSEQSNLDDEPVIETIDLLNTDEVGVEDVNASDLIQSTIPERLEDTSDEENLSESSEYEIDMEAVEEVNKMITGMQVDESEEVKAVTSYFKKLY